MKLKFKTIIFILLLFCFSLFSINQARAGMWGEDIMATEMGIMEDQILKMIHGVIMGALKQAAVKAINGQVSNIISGGGSGSGGAMFITNWDDFLFKNPMEQTDLVMNDFFETITRGTSSSSNYTSFGSSGSGGGYTGQLRSMAEGVTTKSQLPQNDFQQYASDPSQMFAQGNWRAWNAFISNPANNPFGFVLMSQSAYFARLNAEMQKAMIQAVAYQGYLAQQQGGEVTTPGSTIKDIQSQVEDLPNKVIASAKEIPEVITALVTQLITKAITQGIGKAAENAQRNSNSTGSSSSSSSNPNFGIFGNFGRT